MFIIYSKCLLCLDGLVASAYCNEGKKLSGLALTLRCDYILSNLFSSPICIDQNHQKINFSNWLVRQKSRLLFLLKGQISLFSCHKSEFQDLNLGEKRFGFSFDPDVVCVSTKSRLAVNPNSKTYFN